MIRPTIRLGIALGATIVVTVPRGRANAEPTASAAALPDAGTSLMLPALPFARLIGGHGGGGGGGGGGQALIQPSGIYVGVDAGAALMLAAAGAPTTSGFGFGLHVGYRLPSGLAFDLRGDDLGVDAPRGDGPLVAGGIGMRYTVPLFVLMPFAEVHLGALGDGTEVSLAGDATLGLALPVGNHLEFDFSARDWIATVDGTVRNLPMFTLGLEVGFDRGR